MVLAYQSLPAPPEVLVGQARELEHRAPEVDVRDEALLVGAQVVQLRGGEPAPREHEAREGLPLRHTFPMITHEEQCV